MILEVLILIFKKIISGLNFKMLFKISINSLALFLGLMQLYMMAFGTMAAMPRRVIFWTIITLLALLLNPSDKKEGRLIAKLYDIVFLLATAASGIHIYFSWERIARAAGATQPIDIIFGFLALLVVVEVTRRIIGWFLVAIPMFFVLYGVFGANFPGIWGHRGYSFERILTYLYRGTEGIFAIPLAVAATYVLVFVVFGTTLQKFGIGDVFVSLAYNATKRATGGPAKAAVLASALMGTFSGSSTGNVVTTGTFTIPLMKKVGYKGEFAGAVEAAASCGGMIMPPIMGAAAFLMAEITGIPYSKIIIAALFPAILYFSSIFFAVHFRTKGKEYLDQVDDGSYFNDSFDIKKAYLFLPLIFLIVFIFSGMSIPRAGILATISILVVSVIFQREMSLKEKFLRAIDSIVTGVKRVVPVAIACSAAGLIVGMIALTGIGSKVAHMLLIISKESLFLSLLLTAVLTIILSIGLPTTAVYVIVAVLLAPALTRMGVPMLSAHLFIFYFGMMSSLTPPVALGAYAAASIADANPSRTAFIGFRLAMAGFVVPFVFVYNPALVMEGPFYLTITIFVLSFFAIMFFQSSIEGYLITNNKHWERVVLFISAIILLLPTGVHTFITIAIVGIVIIFQITRAKRLDLKNKEI